MYLGEHICVPETDIPRKHMPRLHRDSKAIDTIDYVTGIGNTRGHSVLRGRLILILQLHCRFVSITTQASYHWLVSSPSFMMARLQTRGDGCSLQLWVTMLEP